MLDFASSASLAFLAGVLSVLSPCVMPLMPAYLSLVSGVSVEDLSEAGDDPELRRRVMRACIGFVLGFSTVFVTMGVGAVAIGHTVRTWQASIFGIEFGIAQIAGVGIMLLGLHMTGLLPIRVLYRDTRFSFKGQRRGFVSTFLVGAGFALGWSPCIGPILSTVLALAGSSDTAVQGTLLLTIYSAGLALPFLAAGWSIEAFFRVFRRVRRHFRAIEVASGAILMGVGGLLVSGEFDDLNRRFSFMTDWVTSAERLLQ